MHAGTAQNSAWRLRSRNCLCDDGRRWPERGRSLDSQARILAEWLNDDGRGSAKATTSREALEDVRWPRGQRGEALIQNVRSAGTERA
ncbi:unnamed protein product [Spirodela intermedia]|uniref:Uncharacterized protein n=1 Tax=Spirodela intermedia TaxID=51605 RepID=A0A7I8IFI2_SPIIN|nr:unnamed protein product [Spirodela intermedia]CAA6656381.1 unnamed protein product [Spirodela intermedia]